MNIFHYAMHIWPCHMFLGRTTILRYFLWFECWMMDIAIATYEAAEKVTTGLYTVSFNPNQSFAPRMTRKKILGNVFLCKLTNYIWHLHRRMPVILFFGCRRSVLNRRGACSKSCGGGLLQQKLFHFTGWSGWNEWTPGWLVLNSPHTPLKFNIAPKNRQFPKGNSSSNPHFSGAMFNFGKDFY